VRGILVLLLHRFASYLEPRCLFTNFRTRTRPTSQPSSRQRLLTLLYEHSYKLQQCLLSAHTLPTRPATTPHLVLR
jgi:hypothetical protein